MELYKDDFRCICADLRNANPGRSSGRLEIDRPRGRLHRRPARELKEQGSATYLRDLVPSSMLWRAFEAHAS